MHGKGIKQFMYNPPILRKTICNREEFCKAMTAKLSVKRRIIFFTKKSLYSWEGQREGKKPFPLFLLLPKVLAISFSWKIFRGQEY